MMRALAAVMLVFAVNAASAAEPPVFATGEGAIRGYDPVAYFTEGKPVQGSEAFQSQWGGATFSFASADNQARFEVDPEMYAPQYGGYCAYAVSEGYTATTDPAAWSIVEGKLYLNYSLGVRDLWSQDIPKRIAAADRNWPSVLNK